MQAQPPFNWRDPLLLEEELSETERAARNSIRTYARSRLMDAVTNDTENAQFDPAVMKELGQIGGFGALVPEQYGGSNIGHVAYGLLAFEVEWVDSSYRSALSVQSSLVIHPILTFGSDEQKQQYLPKLVAGDAVGCFGLTEPDHGSDAGAMKTHAKLEPGGDWILNGSKTWITNAPIADVAVVWARDDDGVVRGFLVDSNEKGFSSHFIKNKFSMRASATGGLSFDNIRLPKSAQLPLAKGLGGPFSCLNKARYGISWGAMGAAYFCWNAARDYVMQRSQFGRPLGANQLVQKKLADMQTDVTLGLNGSLRLGRLLDQKRAAPNAISLLKRNNAGKALDIARVARDMHGANGIALDYHVIRHVMNLETVNTYEGTHDVHALILGRSQTDIQAFF